MFACTGKRIVKHMLHAQAGRRVAGILFSHMSTMYCKGCALQKVFAHEAYADRASRSRNVLRPTRICRICLQGKVFQHLLHILVGFVRCIREAFVKPLVQTGVAAGHAVPGLRTPGMI